MAGPNDPRAAALAALRAELATERDTTAPLETVAATPPSSAPAVSGVRPSVPAPEPGPEALQPGVIGKADYTETVSNDIPDYIDSAAIRGRVPHFRVEKGQTWVPILGEGPSGQHVGKLAIDKRKMHNELTEARVGAFRAKYAADNNGAAPSENELKDARAEASVDVGQELLRWEAERRGRGHDDLWVDMDRAGVQASTKRWAESGFAGRMLAPLSSVWHGVDVAYSDGSPESVSYNEGDLMGNLDWAGRMSLFTLFSTAMVASGVAEERKEEGLGGVVKDLAFAPLAAGKAARNLSGWGSPKHLELLGQGHDMFSLAEEVGLNNIIGNTPIPTILSAVGIAEKETTEAVGGQLLALGLSLVDPDILMVASAPKGIMRGVKGVAKAAGYAPEVRAAAIASHVEAAPDILRRAKDSADTVRKASDEMREAGVVGVSPEAISRSSRKEANSAVGEVFAHLQSMEKGGEALAYGVFRLAQNMIASRKPMGKATAHATEAAARAKTRLAKVMESTTEASVTADALVDALAHAKSFKGREAQRGAAAAGALLRATQLQHMAVAMAHQDLLTHRDTIARLGQHLTRKAVDIKSPEGQKMAAELKDAIDNLKTARDVMLETATPANVAAYHKQSDAFASKQLEALDLMGGAAATALDDLVLNFADAEKGAKAAMDAAYKNGRFGHGVRHKTDFATAQAVHEKQYEKMKGASSSLRSDETLYAALGQALDYTAKGFRALERGDTADKMAVVASSIQEVIDGGAHIWGGRPFEVLSAMATNITNPAKAKWEVSDERIQDILTSMSGVPAKITEELSRQLANLTPDAQVQATIAYMAGNGVGIIGNLDDVPMWDRARVILRAQAGKVKGGPPKAFQALAHSFLPSGLNAAAAKSHEGTLYKALREVLEQPDVSFEDVLEAMEQAALHLRIPEVVSRSPKNKSVLYAAQAVATAATLEMTGAKIAKEVGAVTPELAQAMSRIMEPGRAGENYLDALAVFNRMGMPSHLTKTIRDIHTDAVAGVVALTDTSTGYASIIPVRFMDDMDKRIAPFVKATDLYQPKTEDRVLAAAMTAAGRYGRLYQASLVTGLIFPRPRQFTNIAIGNNSQIWADDSMRAAMRSSGQQLLIAPMSMASYIPGVKKWIDVSNAKMAAKMGTDNILPSMWNVINNPAVAFFYDPRMVPNSQVIKTATGTTTFGEIRKMAVTEGVVSTFIGSTGLKDVLARSEKVKAAERWLDKIAEVAEPAANAMKTPGRYYAEIAEVVEERQRVAYFMDLVANRGFSPEEAARKVKDALYDWNSPMSRFEEDTAVKYLMFWGFQRRAMGQALRLLTEPLSANTQGLDAIVATSTGLSAMAGKEANSWAKLKDLTRAQKAMKEAMRSEAEGDDELKRVYPWWASKASSKTFLWNTEMSEKEKLAWEKTGKKATYRAHTLPAFTPLEMADIFASSMEAVANGFRTGGFSGAATSTVKAGLDFAAEGGGSFTEPMLQSVVDELFGQETQFKQEGTRLTKFSDKFFLDSMPFLTGGTYPDKDRPGAVRVNKGVHTLYKLFLPLSYEAVNFVEPAAEAYNVYGDDASLALIHMGQQYSGIFQSYVHDPEAQVVSDKKALERKASTSETEWKKRQGVVPND